MKFFSKIELLQDELEKNGFTVFAPEADETGVDYSKLSKHEQTDVKKNFIDNHIEKIQKSDAILIANYTKNGITNYIGANTFLEMGFAYILKKKIFLLNEIPEQQNTVEIEALRPILLNGNLDF